jgi:hypothetical protein
MTLIVAQDDVTIAYEVGRCIGHFFSELHSLETFTKISPNTLESSSCPARTSQSSIDGAVSAAKSYLKLFSIPDIQVLATRVRENLQCRTIPEELGFVNGDLSAWAILTTPPSLHSAATVAIKTATPPAFGPTATTDFEFAGPGRTLNADIARL